MLTSMKHFSPLLKPIYHLIELVQTAIGEKPQTRIGPRSRAMLLGAIRHQSPKLISRKKFRMPPIEPLD